MSAETHKIYKICSRCQGVGTEIIHTSKGGTQEITCMGCAGAGKTEIYELDIENLQADINKCLLRLKKIMKKIGVWEEGD